MEAVTRAVHQRHLVVGLVAVALVVVTLAAPVKESGAAWLTLYDKPADAAAKAMLRGDGQFYAMLAQDPTLSRPGVMRPGVEEFAYRASRPMLGWMGWIGSVGRPWAVPWVLLGIMAASTVWLAYAMGRLAGVVSADTRVAVWCLALPGVGVLVLHVGPELPAAALSCMAVTWALERHEYWAVAALTGAVLLRETLVLIAVGMVLAGLVRWWRAAVPVGAVLGWVLVVQWRLGAWPTRSRLDLLGLFNGQWGTGELILWMLMIALARVSVARSGRLAWSFILPHLGLLAVTAGDVWVFVGISRVLLPPLAVLMVLAAPRMGVGRPSAT